MIIRTKLLFLQIGVRLYGCPYNESPTIWGVLLGPLIVATAILEYTTLLH